MEEAVAQVKFPGMGEVGVGEDSGSDGDEGEATRAMVTSQNRKGRKSGGFQSMGFSYAVFKGIMKKGYRVPTPIQRRCIPLIMDGKDVVAMARTGSGKTAAFLLPMFERLKTHSTKVGARAVILSPTRELATQTCKFAKELGRFTSLRAVLVLGGDSMEDQFSAIHGNPDIIIATPGRFLHLLVEMDMSLSSVEYVVFDEADRLFEMGFAEQLQDIIKRFPESRQTLLFSATLPRLLVEFAKAGLKDPELVRLNVDSKLSDQLRLFFLSVRKEDKASALLYLLQSVLPATEQTAVFAPTKHHVEYLQELLQQAGIPCTYIYSSLDQTARKINVAKFVSKKVMTMLVTDVAARGIDIPTLDNVINYNFPEKSKLFVHRVGRVARAGRSGSAYSLVSSDEVAYMLDLHLFIGRPLLIGSKSSGRESSGVYGSIPQSLLDEEDERIKQLHSVCVDLRELKKVSDNAQKQYVRSRGPPAPESIKRAKSLSAPLSMHPMFEHLCSSEAVAQCTLLDSLKQYKPSQTIFDIHRTKNSGAAIRKRDVGKRGGQDAKAAPKAEHYIEYTPRDVHSERGLSLANSFDKQANNAILDLDGDEGGAPVINKPRKTKQWDRKRKKFVGESEKEAPRKKRIKTESGQWIQASFKSNAYREWKEKHKIEDFKEGETGLGPPKGVPRFRHKQKAESAKGPVGDLKPKAVILRQRQRKAAAEQQQKKRSKGQPKAGKKYSQQRTGGSKKQKTAGKTFPGKKFSKFSKRQHNK